MVLLDSAERMRKHAVRMRRLCRKLDRSFKYRVPDTTLINETTYAQQISRRAQYYSAVVRAVATHVDDANLVFVVMDYVE